MSSTSKNTAQKSIEKQAAGLVLNVSDLVVSIDKARILDEVSLEVRESEFLGLIGLNGAGKTTFIKSILELRYPDSGVISLFGLKPNNIQAKKNTAYLPERFEPSWFLSGYEFIKFSNSLYGRPFDKAEAEAMAESLALDPKALKRKVRTYSKGMRQKLGVMATVLTGCKFLIFDEPMSGLDPKARYLVKSMLLKAKEEGRTIFVSSHILADMDELCDRIAIMHEGKFLYQGLPKDLKTQEKAKTLEQAFLSVIGG